MTAIVSTSKATVAYRGLIALSEVSLELEAGKITGLIGPNGAGKTTMLGVLSGVVRPTSGRVWLDGKEITTLAPHKRARLGMARTFQRLELWTSMTVEENVRTAADFATSWQRELDPRVATDYAIGLMGLGPIAAYEVAQLTSGQGRLLEVARAVAQNPRILLLDEPSAGLNESESLRLGQTLADYVTESGTTILMVEHHIELVAAICSRVCVLDFGRVIEWGTPAAVRASSAVQEAYLGRRHSAASA